MRTEIRRADPREVAYVALVQASHDHSASLYPAESNHNLDLDALLNSQMHFYGVTVGNVVKGCGGFWRHSDCVEIKSVFIDPSARGAGLSKLLMMHLESEARELGFSVARLETGISQPAALGLYRSLGYVQCGPFGNYRDDPLSVFMEKEL